MAGMRTSIHHEYRPTPVKSRAVRVLPDVLDVVNVPSDESFTEVLVSAFDGLSMSFECSFTPANYPIICLNTYE